MNSRAGIVINLHIRLLRLFILSAYETDSLHSLPASYQLPTNALPTPYQNRPSLVPIERTMNGDVAALAGSLRTRKLFIPVSGMKSPKV